MPSIRVAIVGATGYAGEELIRLLLHHPEVRLTYLAASAKWERPTPVADVFPRFAGRLDLPVESLDLSRVIASSDAVFLALPHGTAMTLVPDLVKVGKRVVDLSGDFRLRDATLYPRWYQFSHPHPDLLRDARVAYGLTEFHREEIQRAQAIANPGCYATSVLLAALPLFRANLVMEDRILVDAKSGLSGAGRKADASLLFTEMTENLRAYKVNNHPHMPEITQEIHSITGCSVKLGFVPQVIPVTRGLISAIYLRTHADAAKVADAYHQTYAADRTPFVRVRPGQLPQLRDVIETNFCDIGFTYDASLETLVVMSALDNLLKGAAGQAVQNFNLMHGLPETTALIP